ncbi:hypothetical protein D3C78_954020 [compost metagenome]
MADHGVHAHRRDRAEQQAQDAAHHRYRDALQQCAELADEGQGDGEDRRPGHDLRVVVLGQHHRAGHFGIGGVGRAAEQASCGGGQAIAQQGAVQAGLLQVVAAGHAADRDHPADVLDRRCQGNRDDEQDGLPVERWRGEVGQLQPRCGGDLGSVDHAKGERQGKAYQHAGNDRHQTEDALAEHGDDQRCQQGRHRDHHGGLVGQQHAAVTGLAHRHVGGDRRHGQADGDDHRADHHRRQHAVDETGAFDFHHQAHEGVHETCGHHAAHGLGQAELALGEDDRGDEGKARGQEHGYLAAGDQLEQQGADTGSEQCDVRIEAGDQWHQHQRAKCHEEHLRARNDLAPERVVEAVLHGQASFCLVPKILSPASPRPGTM